MVGPDYPKGIKVPEVRMYTGYGMNGTIVKPPYSTLTAYDLNTGTIKWQVPAGGDDAARDRREGAKDTGYIMPAHRYHHHANGVAVPGGRGRHAAGLRRRHRPGAVDGAAAGRVARDPGDVRSQWAAVLPRERDLEPRPVADPRAAPVPCPPTWRSRCLRPSRNDAANPILDFGIDRTRAWLYRRRPATSGVHPRRARWHALVGRCARRRRPPRRRAVSN